MSQVYFVNLKSIRTCYRGLAQIGRCGHSVCWVHNRSYDHLRLSRSDCRSVPSAAEA